MPRVHEYKPSFNAGELSPRLHARTDFAKYRSGLEICENLIPLSEGGAMRRAGTRFIAELKSSTVKGRLKRFLFSTTQAYMLEMGDGALRFYRHQGRITVADTDAAVSNGTFGSDISDWDDRSTGGGSIAHDATNNDMDLVPGGSGGVAWAEQDITTTDTGVEHVIKFRVKGDPGDKIEFQVGTTSTGSEVLSAVERQVGYHCVAFTPSASPFYIQFRNLGSNADKTISIDDISLIDDGPVEIDTPWAEADLHEVEGPQSADVLYLFHGGRATHKLLRFGHTTWSAVEVPWQDGPFLAENASDTTLLPSAASGLSVNLTLSSTAGVNDGQGWLSTDVGRHVRYKKSSEWGWAIIRSITSTTVAVAEVKKNFEATPTAVKTFRLGSWSGTTGYPQVGAFFEQRTYVATTTEQPQSFWASQTADFENFKPDDDSETVEDDDALDFTLSADDVNAIRWLSAGADTLVIGTSGGEWVPAADNSAVLNPNDLTVRRQTTHGSAQIQPVRVGNAVLFVQRAKRKLREFAYSFEVDGFQAPDMTRLAQHVSYGGLTGMDFAEEPDSLVYVVRADGQLLSMTYRREEDVIGWARHILGGVLYKSLSKVWRVNASTESFTDETTDAGDTGDADFSPFPGSESVDDYVTFGAEEPFTTMAFDYANGTAGVGGVVAWEYWNGTTWQALTGVTDETSGFTAAAADDLKVTWAQPSDWNPRKISEGPALYYVRARIKTAYSTNPVLDQVHMLGAPAVESVAVIPGDDGGGQAQDSTSRDEVWVIVKRTINGQTKRYVEMLERSFERGHAQEDAYYSDSLITYNGAETTAISGLDHLEGEVVKVWADGAVQAEKTVSSGAITLDQAASVVQVGLGYTHKAKLLKFDSGNKAGTAVGKDKRDYRLAFVLLDCHRCRYGSKSDQMKVIDFRSVGDAMDSAAPLFSGEKVVEFPGNWGTDERILVEDDAPAPFTLLALAPERQVNPMT